MNTIDKIKKAILTDDILNFVVKIDQENDKLRACLESAARTINGLEAKISNYKDTIEAMDDEIKRLGRS